MTPMSVRRLSRRALACTQRAVSSTSGSRLRCTPARRLHSVTRASRRSSSARASAAERVRASRPPPPPPPRCAAPLHARIVAGFRTHTARRLRHLPILSASAPLRHPRPGRWRRDQCMKMEDVSRNGPTNQGCPPARASRQTATDRDGGRGTEPAADAHETSERVFGAAEREWKGSGEGV